MKKSICLLVCVYIFSACTAKGLKVPSPVLPLMKAPETVEIQVADPAEFENSIPTSSILKKSLFVFENTYPRIYSDDDVIAIAAGQKMLAALKSDSVGFTMPYCSSLVTKGNYNKIKIDGYNALVYGDSDVALFSAEECARFKELKRTLRGDIILIGGYLAEWEGSKVYLRDALSGKAIFDGETGLAVATVGIIGEEIVLIHYNGYIMYYDRAAATFAFKGTFPIEFDVLGFSEGKFYGIKKDTKEFFILTETDVKFSGYTECFLSSTSPYAVCGGKLIGIDKSYDGISKVKDFTANDNFFADINNGNMSIYSLKSIWQRFLRLDYNLPAPCLTANGDIYFTNFEGEIVQYSKNKQSIVKERPNKCDEKSITLQGGEFICKKKSCGTFAEKVISKDGDTMFRRIEKGKRYYFFNGLAK